MRIHHKVKSLRWHRERSHRLMNVIHARRSIRAGSCSEVVRKMYKDILNENKSTYK